MRKAEFYSRKGKKEVKCHLCPHECSIGEGKSGICLVRINRDGELQPESYGKVSALHLDPIEKKPLYHFFPGSQILSVGSFGCNFRCRFCQNYQISQLHSESFPEAANYTPEEIILAANGSKSNRGVSFTYNEPTIWYEFMLDIAVLAKKYKLSTVAVTNGFINPDPLKKILPYMDAFNVDLKAFSEEFYRKYTSSRLAPVKQTLTRIKEAGKHLEITNLLIPGLNDSPNTFTEMVKWISREIGHDTVLHLSRYFPVYRMNIHSTPLETMEILYEIATGYLDYVYFGNTGTTDRGRDTFCPGCGNMVIRREGYYTKITGLKSDGTCSHCKRLILKSY